MWVYTSTPPYAFMAWYLFSQAQGQLYLYLVCVLHLTSSDYQTHPRTTRLFREYNAESKILTQVLERDKKRTPSESLGIRTHWHTS
jgi:hypothetical protein